jgi:hypothetical protein
VSHGGIIVTSDVEVMRVPNSRREGHGGTTISCGKEEISLAEYRR